MRRVVFLYSGEGTSDRESGNGLVSTSRAWSEIARVLRERWGLDLDRVWDEEIGTHHCPHSPLLTVVGGICLAEIWRRWGYEPDVVVGHSIGELAAAHEAGLYSLEGILGLALDIGRVAARLDGVMMHGTLTEQQTAELGVCLSSLLFREGELTHVTVSGYREEMENLVRLYPHFKELRPPHPWHHRDYAAFLDELGTVSSGSADRALFASGVTSAFERSLRDDHWKRWLCHPVDFVRTMETVAARFGGEELDVIEIGFHPVLKECCRVFPSGHYASSMYRGEDERSWILSERRRLDPGRFLDRLRKVTDGFRPDLDFAVGLAYQGFTSSTFMEFTPLLEPSFPGLAPQDFFRYKSVQELVDRFGSPPVHEAASGVSRPASSVSIAGMSCRFPAAAQNPAQFWRMLESGEDQVRADPLRGDFEAGFLDPEVSKFDHEYFRLSEAEAATMDPQQILALELTEMLWKDAGLDPETLDRRRVGVYLGVWNDEYAGDRSSVYYPTGTNPSIVASRISYHYDLRGPSWVSNTACSSSLVAIHYACRDIREGRVDFAIAGGVNMILGSAFTRNMKGSGFLSKGQRCKAFDDSADGYVRAEGGGLVLLARSDLAKRSYATILGSAINQNGRRAQLITAPHPEAQEELILEACRDAAIEPQDIAYVECHGTGTRLGDPIEISALRNTVGRNRKGTCFLGSVKSNIGHLESAAGIAGLIKSVLILCKGSIPANLHFRDPNRFIDFDSLPLKVVTERTAIDERSRIGVSSFGFGGTNAHVIIQGVDAEARKSVEDLPVPFDRSRASALSAYFGSGGDGPGSAELDTGSAVDAPGVIDIRALVEETFRAVTSIREIDPEVELIDQGLDSLGATQFLTTLQKRLGVELDPDLLFGYPLFEQLVAHLESVAASRKPARDEVLSSAGGP